MKILLWNIFFFCPQRFSFFFFCSYRELGSTRILSLELKEKKKKEIIKKFKHRKNTRFYDNMPILWRNTLFWESPDRAIFFSRKFLKMSTLGWLVLRWKFLLKYIDRNFFYFNFFESKNINNILDFFRFLFFV